MHDASIMIFQAIYYRIWPYWEPLHIFGLCFAVLMLVTIFFIPESPKYYYSKGRFNEAREILNQIARHNKVKFKFDRVRFDTERESIFKSGAQESSVSTE